MKTTKTSYLLRGTPSILLVLGAGFVMASSATDSQYGDKDIREQLVKTGDDNLDHLAVFLADVTENEYGEDNWKLRKQDRIFNGTDATLILQFYTLFNRGDNPDAQDCWNTIVPNRFGDIVG